MLAFLEIARICKALKLFADLEGPICYKDPQNNRYGRVKFAYHFHINYDLNLETAEFLALVLCDSVKLWSTQGTNANYM